MMGEELWMEGRFSELEEEEGHNLELYSSILYEAAPTFYALAHKDSTAHYPSTNTPPP